MRFAIGFLLVAVCGATDAHATIATATAVHGAAESSEAAHGATAAATEESAVGNHQCSAEVPVQERPALCSCEPPVAEHGQVAEPHVAAHVDKLMKWQYANHPQAPTYGGCSSLGLGRCGPAFWDKICGAKACAGKGDQSPIALHSQAATKVNKELVLAGPSTPECSSTRTCVDACALAHFEVNQHTAEVVMPSACAETYKATVEDSTIDPTKKTDYYLAQFHYHSPSEHTLDGQYFPMETHHVHKTRGVTPERVLVIAVFMTADKQFTSSSCASSISLKCKRAQFFDKVLTLGLGSHAKAQARVRITNPPSYINANVSRNNVSNDAYTNFIPGFEHLYNYVGSFTTPPCTVGVEWFLHPTAVAIFDTSLVAYRTLISKLQANQLNVLQPSILWQPNTPWGSAATPFTWNTSIGTNNRDLQPLGNGLSTRKLHFVGNRVAAVVDGSETHMTLPSIIGAVVVDVDDTTSFHGGDTVWIGSTLFSREYSTIHSVHLSKTTLTSRRLGGASPGQLGLLSPLKFPHNMYAKVAQAASTTSTLTPWDSSSITSNNKLDSSMSISESDASARSDASDPSGLQASSGFKTSGSSGSYITLWKWLVIVGCLWCCCFGLVSAICKPRAVKKQKKKTTEKAAPAPASPPEVMPLLTTAMPMAYAPTTAYAPTSMAYAPSAGYVV